jgi:hypothetical protein
MPTKKILIYICLVFALGSCSRTMIAPKGTAQVKSPEHKFTVWTFLWGLTKDDHYAGSSKLDCHGNGLSRVTIRNNAGYILITVVTAGIVVPTRIECDCAKDGQPEN